LKNFRTSTHRAESNARVLVLGDLNARPHGRLERESRYWGHTYMEGGGCNASCGLKGDMGKGRIATSSYKCVSRADLKGSIRS